MYVPSPALAAAHDNTAHMQEHACAHMNDGQSLMYTTYEAHVQQEHRDCCQPLACHCPEQPEIDNFWADIVHQICTNLCRAGSPTCMQAHACTGRDFHLHCHQNFSFLCLLSTSERGRLTNTIMEKQLPEWACDVSILYSKIKPLIELQAFPLSLHQFSMLCFWCLLGIHHSLWQLCPWGSLAELWMHKQLLPRTLMVLGIREIPMITHSFSSISLHARPLA